MKKTEHLLIILAEECAEVAQRCSKALRFGLDEVQPGQEKTNGQRIADEMADLSAAWQMLRDRETLPSVDFTAITEKKAKVKRFLQYSVECGALDPYEVTESPDTRDEITDDDVITVARWLPNIRGNEVRRVIRFGLARGLGHAATDEELARKIVGEYLA